MILQNSVYLAFEVFVRVSIRSNATGIIVTWSGTSDAPETVVRVLVTFDDGGIIGTTSVKTSTSVIVVKVSLTADAVEVVARVTVTAEAAGVAEPEPGTKTRRKNHD